MRLVYPDLSGRYDIAGLPPGAYLVSVVDELYEGELFDREVLDVIARAGREATIEAGETTTLDLMIGGKGERLAQSPGGPLATYPSSSYSPSAGGRIRVEGRKASR